ncbi:MAG: hypothetical protein U0470_05295 [Anaerolineae bacterium]
MKDGHDDAARSPWRPHRYLLYGFLEDRPHAPHRRRQALACRHRGDSDRWLQVPLFFLMGLVLSDIPGRVPPGPRPSAPRTRSRSSSPVSSRNTVHALGHIVSGAGRQRDGRAADDRHPRRKHLPRRSERRPTDVHGARDRRPAGNLVAAALARRDGGGRRRVRSMRWRGWAA